MFVYMSYTMLREGRWMSHVCSWETKFYNSHSYLNTWREIQRPPHHIKASCFQSWLKAKGVWAVGQGGDCCLGHFLWVRREKEGDCGKNRQLVLEKMRRVVLVLSGLVAAAELLCSVLSAAFDLLVGWCRSTDLWRFCFTAVSTHKVCMHVK